MYGRYTLLADELDIISAFDLNQDRIENYEPSYNVAPGQDILAVIHDGKEKRAGYLKWGLVPSWAQDEKIGYKMINARSETAHEKPSFKKLMNRKRCLIIADSFYEWKETNSGKQPKRIQLEKRGLFAFAGLWDKWVHDNKTLFTCTILTKDANAFMQDIHHRMPIILPETQEEEWIAANFEKPADAHQFLQGIETESLTAYDVDTYVNTAKNNDATCIKPIA
jgi:putative SOS response-associated peptidase YedK